MPQPIDVRVAEARHLFDAMDPSPAEERDLSAAVEGFIVDSARELAGESDYHIRIQIGTAATGDQYAVVKRAISYHFNVRALAAQRRLRRLFQLGRQSLAIALVFMVVVMVISEVIVNAAGQSHAVRLIGESLTIVAWVAMWRPLEVFLYDWWPIRADIRIYQKLAASPVEIVQGRSSHA